MNSIFGGPPSPDTEAAGMCTLGLHHLSLESALLFFFFLCFKCIFGEGYELHPSNSGRHYGLSGPAGLCGCGC